MPLVFLGETDVLRRYLVSIFGVSDAASYRLKIRCPSSQPSQVGRNVESAGQCVQQQIGTDGRPGNAYDAEVMDEGHLGDDASYPEDGGDNHLKADNARAIEK